MTWERTRRHLGTADDRHTARVSAAQAWQPFTRNVARDTRTPDERRAALTMSQRPTEETP